MHGGRLFSGSPPTEREEEARERIVGSNCDARHALFFPGLGQLCRGRTVEGDLLTYSVMDTVLESQRAARLQFVPQESPAKRPVLFGREMNSAIGYPLAAGIGVGLFEHVALAEESAFRGLLQSSWARSWGEERLQPRPAGGDPFLVRLPRRGGEFRRRPEELAAGGDLGGALLGSRG